MTETSPTPIIEDIHTAAEAAPPPATATPLAPPIQRWEGIAVFVVTLLFYALLTPRMTAYLDPPSGDEVHYMMTALSIIEDGDFNECNNFRQHDYNKLFPAYLVQGQPTPAGYLGWRSPFYPLPPYPANIESSRGCNLDTSQPATAGGIGGELYTIHGIGLSVLIAPALALAGRLGVVYFLNLLGALLAANIFLLAREGTGRRLAAALTWLAFAFSIPIFAYSFNAFTEMPAALMLIYPLRRIRLWNNNWAQFLGIGFCIGFLPLLHYRYTLFSAPLFIYFLYQAYRDRAAFRQRWRNYLLMLLPIVACAIFFVIHDLIVYHTVLPGLEVYIGFADQPLFGQFGLLLDQQYGLFIAAPILILSIVGIILMAIRRGWRGELFWHALLFVPYFALISSFLLWWGEWGPPARYLVSLEPLLVLPFALALDRIRTFGYKIIYTVLMAPTLAILFAYIVQPQWMYGPSGESNLLLDVVFPWLAKQTNNSLDSLKVENFLPAFVESYYNKPTLQYIPSLRQAWMVSLWVMGVIVLLVLLSFALYWWQGRKPRGFVFYTDKGAAFRFVPPLTAPLRINRPLALRRGATLAALVLLGAAGYLIYKGAANAAPSGVTLSAQGITPLPTPTTLQPQFTVPAGALTLLTPRAITVDPAGNIYIGDDGAMSISKYDLAGRFITSWPVFGGPSADKSRRLTDIAVDKNQVYVAVLPNRYIEVYSSDGKLLGQRNAGGSDQLAQPMGLCLDGGGNLYVADNGSQRILKINANDELVATLGASDTLSPTQRLAGAVDCAVAQDGAIYATDRQQRVVKYNPDGSFATQWLLSLNGDQKRLALAGNRLYISDQGTNSVVVLDTAAGKVLTYGGAGNLPGQFTGLGSVATDGQGRIYAVDTNSTWAQVFAAP